VDVKTLDMRPQLKHGAKLADPAADCESKHRACRSPAGDATRSLAEHSRL
jgi:hypothetical protein